MIAGPVVFVIFGAAGDLTWRKLIPALFNLHLHRALPAKFAIIGVDHTTLGAETLRKRLHEGVRQLSNLGSLRLRIGRRSPRALVTSGVILPQSGLTRSWPKGWPRWTRLGTQSQVVFSISPRRRR
jgi:glucose-6-phosphate 1-dehydrogenase